MQQATQQPKKARNGLAALAQQVMDAPVPAAPKEKTPRAKPSEKKGMLLEFAKDFKPRTDNIVTQGNGKFAQQHNWDALVAAFDEAEDGQITYEQAIAAVLEAGKKGGYETTCNAKGFVAGRIRGGHVEIVK